MHEMFVYDYNMHPWEEKISYVMTIAPAGWSDGKDPWQKPKLHSSSTEAVSTDNVCHSTCSCNIRIIYNFYFPLKHPHTRTSTHAHAHTHTHTHTHTVPPQASCMASLEANGKLQINSSTTPAPHNNH